MAPLTLETEEEKALFKKGEESYNSKKALRTRSLLEKSPDAEESNVIHAMWKKEMSYLSTYSKTPALHRKFSERKRLQLISQNPESPPPNQPIRST